VFEHQISVFGMLHFFANLVIQWPKTIQPKKNIAAPQGQLHPTKPPALTTRGFSFESSPLVWKRGPSRTLRNSSTCVFQPKLPKMWGKDSRLLRISEVFTKCDPCDQLMAGRQGKM